MRYNNQKFLTVCAAALLVASSMPASAQDATALTGAPVQPSAQMPDTLPLPTGAAPAAVAVQAPVVTAPSLPSDVVTPAAGAMSVPPVAYNARGTDKIVTLRDAVAVGVRTNPETESLTNNRRATDEELRQAKALYLPSIDMNSNGGYESIYSDVEGAAPGHSDMLGAQASLTLTQMLFDGFSTKYENQRQFHRVRSASHRVRESSEYKGLDVIESYLDLLRQRELLTIAQENLKQHNDIMGQIIESANAGRTTQADVEQTKARVNAAEAQEAAVRESLRNAESNYRRVVGDAPQPDLQIPVAPRTLLESDVENEVKQALTHSPTMDTKEADVNVADAELKGTKSTFYPKVDFQAGASVGQNLDGVRARNQKASAMLVANWNLYRGGGDEARAREFNYRLAQAKDERNASARAIEQDVRRTWASMNAASERATAFRKQADANRMVVEAYKDQFNLDRRTLLDVLDSQNEWFVSRSNAINNGYLEMFAVYRLLSLRGQLLPTLGVAYPHEVDPAYTSRQKGYKG